MEQTTGLKSATIRVQESLDQQVMPELNKRRMNRSELYERLLQLGIPALEALLGPDWIKMRLVMGEDTKTRISGSASPAAIGEPELPDPDLIVKYENCIYRAKKDSDWDSDRIDKDVRILGDIRRLWEANKTSNAKFRAAIEKINYALNVDLQAAASRNRLSQIAVARQLRGYMKAHDAKYLDELAKLLEHLQKVSASGKMLSEQDLATTNRIDYLVPFYKTDRTLAELESEVMASLVDNYLDNSPWRISAKLTEREDLISWVMKKLAAAGKIKLDPAYPSFEWYNKVK